MENHFTLSRRSALKLLGGGLALPFVGVSRAAGSSGVMPAGKDTATLLFFDDEFLFARRAVTRRLGEPRRVASYHELLGNCTWGRPAVFRLGDGTWRMVYQAGVGKRNRGGGIVLLAGSNDGLEWRPVDTRSVVRLPGRVAPHQILPEIGNYCSVIADPRAEPARRFKLLASEERTSTSIWCSSDLVAWQRSPQGSWHPSPPDPPAFPFWNEVAGRYMITTRPEWPDRRICLVESDNWSSFSDPRLILQADADDRALAQHYGLYVWPYEGYFVGLLWVFYAGDAAPASAPHRYRGGKVETYLAYSLNGMHWQRCLHEPLFRNGEPGSPDAGCLQVANLVQMEDGSIRAYGACSTNEHGICPPEDGHIVAYHLRRDGLVGLHGAEEGGFISTRALFWRGGDGALNVGAAAGSARVRAIEARGKAIHGFGFEDCETHSSDATEWIPRWKNGRTLTALSGRMIRLEIELQRATLYAIRGDFVLARLGGLERWEKQQLAPAPQRGL